MAGLLSGDKWAGMVKVSQRLKYNACPQFQMEKQ